MVTINNAVDTTLAGQSGTGAFVGSVSTSLVTPDLGVATATTINGNIISTSSGTLSMGAGKTISFFENSTFSNTVSVAGVLTLAGGFTTVGSFASTFTMTGVTAVTFPTSGTLATTSDIPSLPLSLANGGTNASLVASNGGIVYSTASAFAVLAGTATAGRMLRSGASTTPAWSTATFPATGGTAGNVLISDGTNYISSTSLWPNTVGTAGKIVRSDGTVNAYTTSTFADTYAVSTLLYASASNAVSGLATANSSVLVTTSTGVPVQAGTMTNGQLVIGSTGNTPVVSTLIAGTGISVVNSAGTITLATRSGGLEPFTISGTTQTAIVNAQYIALNSGQTTVTLPTVFAVGDIVSLVGGTANTGGWILDAPAGDTIRCLTTTTSSGGTITSTAQAGEAIEVICDVANSSWVVRHFTSTILTTS